MRNLLFDALLEPHANNPARFLVGESFGEISFSEMHRLSGKVANALTSIGLSSGDRLVVQIGKSPMSLAIYLGAVRAGVVFLPLNTAYTSREVQSFLQDSGAKVMVGSDGEQFEGTASDVEILFLSDDGKSGTFADLVRENEPNFDSVFRGPDDLAALLYTSGTTGRSKGAMLSHRNLLSNAKVLRSEWRFSSDDVLLHMLPVFHTHGLFVATNIALLSGAAMIFEPRFDLDNLFKHLPEATSMMGVPTFYTRMLTDERLTREATHHMRLFVSGSAPLPAEAHRAFEERTGHQILERYGMTETNMNTSNPYNAPRRAGTVGKALPGVELKICDPASGRSLGTDEIGMVKVRGENVFSGYWNMPEKTAEEFDSDGFFTTGDLGKLDDQEFLHIVGRDKDLIISGGYNIYPKEIESAVDAVDGVEESAIVGAPHSDLGEAVVAFVVLEAGVSYDAQSLISKLSDQLARFKHPRSWHFVSELPRNAMGKVQKNVLRDACAGDFAS